MSTPALFTPYTLRDVTARNRVWMPPMCQYSAAPAGDLAGVATDWHFTHQGARAAGGTGLIITEATAVSPEGRISPYDLGLWNDTQTQALRRITAFLKDQGTVPAIQLGHAGRKASTERTWVDRGRPLAADEPHGWRPLAPSAHAFSPAHTTPDELTREQIDVIVRQFADAATRALAAGYQAVEIHGAHGYLIHEFLSPHTNHRTDAYGASFEGRTRLALEVVDAVRAVWPEHLPLFFRTSATDWLSEDTTDQREGWTSQDTVRLAKELLARGVDLMDVSTGGLVPDAHIDATPGFQVPFAEAVRTQTGMPVAAVGLITEARQAEDILASGHADAVLIGRELLRDPSWARRAAAELDADFTGPVQYHRA
ncbi:NADH:flavin oxidoreductase/NADH oxidase [Streptomyces rubellomurinus]|uniref:Oxidoreductase n=1 Tax=Streptomyces rubellomurinus (strain ATCC 31215) TaxID=359131 RepID=A0A0F2T432_STRR3|nr:NADH:flavin oxidoreductase/NADH oxidase [Streptomyces rubellomurinus]KJS57943.1 oxidoreductase [Streptomyces rubellomurinus]